ncbi:NAD(P)-binding domain-containing protein [Synergistaceae bacterium OttesenSCG-928-I11]|nr:NAD(P)-binding domain-containing protein [Synergistaceae bacterium OttesenSCG-928-I11]
MSVNATVGFIGTGGIASALAKGFCGSGDFRGKVHVYDLDPKRTEALRESYPDSVVVAKSNQEVIDAAEFVFPTLLPHILEQVAPSLTFRKENRVVHIAAGTKLSKATPWFEPAQSVVRAVPLPFASRRMGPVVLFGDDGKSEHLLSLLGSVVKVKTEKDLEVLASVTGLMVSYYGLMGEIVKWCTSRDMVFQDALDYTNLMCEALSQLMRKDCPEDIEHFLMEHITPQGTNELALNMLRERGAYAPWIEALDKIGLRYDV